jgi:hypothetical protein
MTEVKSVAEFKKTLETSRDRLIVVDFFATWYAHDHGGGFLFFSVQIFSTSTKCVHLDFI